MSGWDESWVVAVNGELAVVVNLKLVTSDVVSWSSCMSSVSKNNMMFQSPAPPTVKEPERCIATGTAWAEVVRTQRATTERSVLNFDLRGLMGHVKGRRWQVFGWKQAFVDSLIK